MSLILKLRRVLAAWLAVDEPERKTTQPMATKKESSFPWMDNENFNEDEFATVGELISQTSITRTPLELDKLASGNFPKIKDGKIHSQKFLETKRGYINDAFNAVRPYYEYVTHLPPIARDATLSKCIAMIMCGFIDRFWDMPSSREHHDMEPFGHLVHSLEVACKQASMLSRINVMHESGVVDSERTRKERPYIVIAGFIAGLLHDCDKIFCYDLACELSATIHTYTPFHGSASVLEFNMKYPQSRMKKGWKTNEYPNLNYRIHVFYEICPKQLRKIFSGELYEFIYFRATKDKNAADAIATKESLMKDNNYLMKLQACTYELIQQDDSINSPYGWGFKISESWYIVLHNTYFDKLGRKMKHLASSCAQALIDSGVMFSVDASGRAGHVFNLMLFFSNDSKPRAHAASFIASPYIEDLILAEDKNRKKIPIYSVKILEQQKNFITALGLNPAIPDSVFINPEKNNNNSPQQYNLDIRYNEADTHDETFIPDPAGATHAPLKQDTNSSPQINQTPPPATGEKAEIMQKATSTHPPMEAPEKTQVEPKGTRTPVQLCKDLERKLSPEFKQCIFELPLSLARALANVLGVKDVKVAPPLHFQKEANNQTVFYLQQNKLLLARTPGALRFAWESFNNEKAIGRHAWSHKIPDMPVSFNGEDLVGSALMRFIYEEWAKLGLLIPSGQEIYFTLKEYSVVLVKKYSHKLYVPASATVSGDFITLDPTALIRLVDYREGRGSLQNALNQIHSIAFPDNHEAGAKHA